MSDSDNQKSCQVEEFELLPKYKKDEALRWINIIRAYEQFCQASGNKAPYKVRRDFLKRYAIDHPEEKHFKSETLRTKIKNYEVHGIMALAPGWGKTKNYAEWADEAKAFIKQKFLNINQPTISWCNEQLEIEALRRGWKLPSRTTRKRYLLQIPKETQDYYRKGRRYWLNHYIPSVLRDLEKINPGEIFEADHCQINCAVRHPSGKVLFPWFSSWLDVGSRMIVGWRLAITPSSDSINLSLMDAISKYTIPEHCFIDNGRDFSSLQFTGGVTKRFRFKIDENEIQGIYLLLKIIVHFNFPANPKSKGSIERFFWTEELGFQKAFITYRGNNILNRPENVDSRIKDGKLIPDWNEFCDYLGNYIDHYNQDHKHSGHGMNNRTPIEVWNEFFRENPVRKVSPASLRLLMMKSSRPTKVGRFGIRAFDNFYRSDQIMERQGEEVLYKYDPTDLEKVYVYDIKWSFIEIAQRVRRTLWNDQEAYREIKSLEKRKRKAIKDHLETAERLISIETGYQKYDVKEEKPENKIVQILHTPFDGVQGKIEESSKDEGEDKSDGIISLFRKNFSIDKDVCERENVTPRSFLKLNIDGVKK